MVAPKRKSAAKSKTATKPKSPAKPKTAAKSKAAAKPAKAKPAAVDSTLAFAIGSARTTLEAFDDGSVLETAAGLEFRLGDTLFATLESSPRRLVVAFLAPKGVALPTRAKFTPVAGRAGWVQLELPVSRDPRPWLDADIGALVGQTQFELKHGADRSITSHGGPYVVVPSDEISYWKPKTKLGKVADDVSIVTLPRCEVLALGVPDTMHWLPSANGGVLARVVSMDADDDAAIPGQVAAVPADLWQARGTFTVQVTSLLAFDASLSKIKLWDTLQLGLTPARYAVSAATFKPDDDTELLLVRLAR